MDIFVGYWIRIRIKTYADPKHWNILQQEQLCFVHNTTVSIHTKIPSAASYLVPQSATTIFRLGSVFIIIQGCGKPFLCDRTRVPSVFWRQSVYRMWNCQTHNSLL